MTAVPDDVSNEQGARSWLPLILTVGVIVAAMAMLFVWMDRSMPRPPLPVYSTIHNDLEAVERSGQSVRISDLRGKVMVCAYIYTVCPHGCAAVIAQMQKLHQAFGRREDFHQVSISVIPERDTSSFLAGYAQGLGLKPDDHWWFLSGAEKPLHDFMTHELKLEPAKPIPEDERVNPLDLAEHDLRIVLIDRQGRVRGYYSVFHPQPEIASLMCERLFSDTERLLNDPQA